MGAYELIQTMELSAIEILLSKGLLSSNIKRDLKVYEFYTNERKTVGCMQARTNTAEHFYTSEETVKRIIKKLK